MTGTIDNQRGLLTSRRIIVTGGANGIGAAVANRFAELGAIGMVLDVSAGAIDAVPANWHSAAADVRDETSVAAAVQIAVERLGGIDGVVAAAGVVPTWQATTHMDLADFERVFAINVLGVATTIKHAARVLTSGATITVVGSMNSWRGDPNILSYAASKHAALGIVRSAAQSLGPNGIRVNAVAPGPIATDALRSRMAGRRATTGLDVDEAITAAGRATSLGRIATVTEVVGAITFLTSAMSSGITGQLLNVDCGII